MKLSKRLQMYAANAGSISAANAYSAAAEFTEAEELKRNELYHELVSELRQMQKEAHSGIALEDGGSYGVGVTKGLAEAADLVEKKLGVKP